MISSTSNPRIKRLVRLRKRRHRDSERVVLIEGAVELRRAVERGLQFEAIYANPDVADMTAFPEGVPVEELTADVLAKAAMRDSTEGFIAVATQPSVDLSGLDLSADPLILVLEGIEKPGNLGAMLRTADAAGVDAVLVADPTTDVWNPNAVRASIGCVFTVPIAVATTEQVLGWLSTHGVPLVATTPAASTSLFDTDLTGGLAIAVGAEHDGLSDDLLRAADLPVFIPMAGHADSLNASVSAAICLFEAVRQRRSAERSP